MLMVLWNRELRLMMLMLRYIVLNRAEGLGRLVVREKIVGHWGSVGRWRKGFRDPHLRHMLRTCIAKATPSGHHEVRTLVAVHSIQAFSTLVAA